MRSSTSRSVLKNRTLRGLCISCRCHRSQQLRLCGVESYWISILLHQLRIGYCNFDRSVSRDIIIRPTAIRRKSRRAFGLTPACRFPPAGRVLELMTNQTCLFAKQGLSARGRTRTATDPERRDHEARFASPAEIAQGAHRSAGRCARNAALKPVRPPPRPRIQAIARPSSNLRHGADRTRRNPDTPQQTTT